MKTLLKPALLAGIMLMSAPQAALAAKTPPAPEGPVHVQGVAIADLDGAIASSDASRAAAQQRPVTYKVQIDAYQARGQQVQAQLQPLADKFNRDRQAPNPNQASLQQQAAVIQQMQESAQRELNEIIKPVVYSEAYVSEQIEEKLDQAVKNAMAAGKVTLLLKPDAVLATENSYNLGPAILAELNKLIPTAQLVPPTGWEPRQVREARAAQAAKQQGGQAASPAAAPAQPVQPAGPQIDGR